MWSMPQLSWVISLIRNISISFLLYRPIQIWLWRPEVCVWRWEDGCLQILTLNGEIIFRFCKNKKGFRFLSTLFSLSISILHYSCEEFIEFSYSTLLDSFLLSSMTVITIYAKPEAYSSLHWSMSLNLYSEFFSFTIN